MDLDSIPREMLELLQRYGFDREQFLDWQRKVAEGRLSPDSNIVRGKLEAPEPDAWTDYPKRGTDEHAAAEARGQEAIRNGEVGAIVLNGGMATRFGGRVKGVVEALPGRSFLQLKATGMHEVARRLGGSLGIFLMNSYATDEDTREHCRESADFGLPEGVLDHFTQGVSLRMTPEGDLFVDDEGHVSPHGPGHGDCPTFFRRSGCLARFLAEGGRYLFISNVDNLAARLDPVVIGMHILSGARITTELAPKWEGDQGGAPVVVDGEIWIVEGFRFPPGFDQDQIPVFNTNTFTVDAEALDHEFRLTPCYVRKQVGDREAVQIETLLGELTRLMPTHYLRVKRTGRANRFFPIKTPQDLEQAREDLEALTG
ncbi:MAG: UTP--glucose-1-phosphate uridylyltransferase [Planctomycetota bacterium]